MQSLENLCDQMAGKDSLATLATRAGIEFGCAVPAENYTADAQWKALFRQNSNCYMLGNGKMDTLQPSQGTFDFTKPNALIADAGDLPAPMLHVLIYPVTAPAWMQSAATSENWQSILDAHLTGAAPLIAQCGSLQVVNEAIATPLDGSGGNWRSSWLNTACGGDGSWVNYSFTKCKALYPTKPRWISDNYLEMDQADGKWTLFDALVQDLVSDETLDGVAMQGHIQSTWTFSGAKFRSRLQTLFGYGLDVAITEMDVVNATISDADAFKAQAGERIERLMDIALEEGVTRFTTWGAQNDWSFWNGEEPSYTQYPLPWDANGRPTQVERAIRRALRGAAGA